MGFEAPSADQVKKVIRICFAVALLVAFVCYLVEFVRDQSCRGGDDGDDHKRDCHWHHGHVGFIFLFVFIVLFILVGGYACWTENWRLVALFVVCFVVLVVVDEVYIGRNYALTSGVVCLVFAVIYAFLLF